jgi:hypothetical protein
MQEAFRSDVQEQSNVLMAITDLVWAFKGSIARATHQHSVWSIPQLAKSGWTIEGKTRAA